MHETKKLPQHFFLKFFPCKRSNDGVLVVKAAAMSNSTTRLTWHFSHVPSKQNRVYGPCFYLDYAPQAAKLHQSSTNFLLGLLLREKKEVMRNTGVSYHVLLTLFPSIQSPTFEKYLLTGHPTFWVASLALYPFQIGQTLHLAPASQTM